MNLGEKYEKQKNDAVLDGNIWRILRYSMARYTEVIASSKIK